MFSIVDGHLFAFMSFVRCSSLVAVSGKARLPTFPCVLPAECNPRRGLVSVQFLRFACAEPFSDQFEL
jgi:hypothetical protein